MESAPLSTDGRLYYTQVRDPEAVFNRLEITLSHLFRTPMTLLRGRTYSECLLDYLEARNCLRPDVLELGCGLGDIAEGLLDAARRRPNGIRSYRILDISPQMLAFVEARLGRLVEGYHLGDCTELSSLFPTYDGLVLCNAVIADLRSDYLKPGQDLREESAIAGFARAWVGATGPTYIHVGALALIAQLDRMLSANGTACILEFAATAMNQPAVFTDPEAGTDHYKCGIDFQQLLAFSEQLGFEAEVFPIEAVLGIAPGEEFLTVDVFTRLAEVVNDVPAASVLGAITLPVAAYTRKSLAATLARAGVPRAAGVVEALRGLFRSIHDPRFDRTNPMTWGYKVLTLRRPTPTAPPERE